MTSFYLLTDTHYFSKSNWVMGKPALDRVRENQIALLETPEILDSYIDFILSDESTNIVFFLGDNVDNADMNSHYEFRQRLEKLVSGGKKVYMTYATHDYIGGDDDENNFQHSLRLTADGTEPLPFMKRGELADFYYDFTEKNALDVHKKSGSYSVKLDEKTRLIAVIDNGNGRSFCGLTDDGPQWLEEQIKKANEKNEYVLLAVHHPVLPPWDCYKNAAEDAMYGGYKELCEMMCRENVRVVFTGHTHVQSIKEYTGENGNSFYDVATVSLANAYGKMRKVTVDDDGLCTVESIETDFKGISKSKEELYRQNFPGIWEDLLPLAVKDYSDFLSLADGYLPVEKLKKLKIPLKLAFKRIDKMTLYSAARLTRVGKRLSGSEKEEARGILLKSVAFEMLRHIFTGNAPFKPDTVEYKVVSGALSAADALIEKLNLKKIKNAIPDLSLKKIADDFLYNNRTGDDDSIKIYLK